MSALEGSEGVLTCGTFSKTVAPGLRVGWVLGHEALVQRCDLLRFDNGISTVLLAGLAVFVSEGLWDAQIDKVQKLYRRKMLAFTGALREHCADFLSFQEPREEPKPSLCCLVFTQPSWPQAAVSTSGLSSAMGSAWRRSRRGRPTSGSSLEAARCTGGSRGWRVSGQRRKNRRWSTVGTCGCASPSPRKTSLWRRRRGSARLARPALPRQRARACNPQKSTTVTDSLTCQASPRSWLF